LRVVMYCKKKQKGKSVNSVHKYMYND
jgi:hypothetical protein